MSMGARIETLELVTFDFNEEIGRNNSEFAAGESAILINSTETARLLQIPIFLPFENLKI